MSRTVRKTLQLPHDFAQQILDCDIEITLSDDPPKNAFKKLTQLYMMGVEYYESIRNYRYIYFNKKMNNLFKLMQSIQFSSAVQSNDESKQIKSPLKAKMNSKNQAQRIEALMIKQRQQKLKNAINQSTLSKNTGSQVKDFLSKSELILDKYQSKVKQQINDQEKRLHSKLLQRRMSNLNKFSIDRSLSQLRDQSTRSSLYEQLDENSQVTQPNKKPLKFNFALISIVDQQEDDDNQVRKRQVSQTNQNTRNLQPKSQRNAEKLKKCSSELINE